MASILATGGKLTPSPYGSEGKYFAFTVEGAIREGSLLQKMPGFTGGYSIIGTSTQHMVMPTFVDATPLGPVPSITIPNEMLGTLSTVIVIQP